MIKPSQKMQLKMKMVAMIAANADIRAALEVSNASEDITYKRVLPYLYIDDIQDEVRSLVCVEVNNPQRRSYANEYFHTNDISVWVISHRDDMRTEFGGTRVDVLENIILNEFAWENELGLELKPNESIIRVLSNKYYAREILFNQVDLNNLNCGTK